MGLLPINFITNTRKLAFSDTNPAAILLPPVYQEESPLIIFKALKQTSLAVAPFLEKQNLNGYSLQISIGSAATILASQNVWSLVEGGYALEAELNLNTAGIAALGTSPSQQTLEIKLSKGTTLYKGQFVIQVYKGVALSGALVPPAGDRALGALEADRTFMRKEGRAGEGLLLTSEGSLSQGFIYWHDDGSFRAEKVV